MSDYIIREATCGDCVHAKICEHMPTLTGFDRSNVAYCQSFINAEDVRPVVHGEWVFDSFTAKHGNPYICSCCNWEYGDTHNFCPNCGAMIGGNNG